MAFRKKTLRDLEVAEGDTVLVRADLNVPLEGGAVADDARIRAALPAIEELRSRGAKIVLCSHLGRPKGHDLDTSMAPVSKRLGELLGMRVFQAPEVVGPEVRRGAARLDPGEILMLENTRWDSGETKNDAQLARDLADLADSFVLDAFGSAHRPTSAPGGGVDGRRGCASAVGGGSAARARGHDARGPDRGPGAAADGRARRREGD